MKAEGEGLHHRAPGPGPRPLSSFVRPPPVCPECHAAPHRRRCRHPGRRCADARPSIVDSGAPLGLALEQLQPLDKPLRWPLAPDERQPRAHGGCTLEQALHEGSQLLHPGWLHRGDPGIPRVASTLTEQAAERLAVVRGVGPHRVKAAERGATGLIARALVCRVRQQQAGRAHGS
jgi:hypothetical protein